MNHAKRNKENLMLDIFFKEIFMLSKRKRILFINGARVQRGNVSDSFKVLNYFAWLHCAITRVDEINLMNAPQFVMSMCLTHCIVICTNYVCLKFAFYLVGNHESCKADTAR